MTSKIVRPLRWERPGASYAIVSLGGVDIWVLKYRLISRKSRGKCPPDKVFWENYKE